MGNAGNPAKSFHNDRDGRQPVTFVQRIELMALRLPLRLESSKTPEFPAAGRDSKGKQAALKLGGAVCTLIRKMLFSEVPLTPDSSGEIVAKTARDDSMGKPRK